MTASTRVSDAKLLFYHLVSLGRDFSSDGSKKAVPRRAFKSFMQRNSTKEGIGKCGWQKYKIMK